jgi:hypothetical protein
MSANVLEEHVATILRVEEYAKQEASGLFVPEVGGDMFLRTVV